MKTIREILKTAFIRFRKIINMPFKSEAQSILQLNRSTFHLYVQPMQLVTYFIVLFISLSIQKLSAQNTFQLNGRNLILQEGQYYELTSKDTVLVDVNNVIVKFKPGQENIGTTLLENTQGLFKKHQLLNNELHFKLPPSSDFITAINTLINTEEVYSVRFGYLLKAKNSESLYRTSTGSGTITSGNNNLSENDRSWPNDEQQVDFWELVKTHIAGDYSGNNLNAWDYSVGNPNIIVAVIDNGLVWNDADFSPANTLGYDYFDGDSDVTPLIPSNLDIEMGTAVASIIAARTSNEHAMYGVAGGFYTNETTPPVTLMVLRAFSENYFYSTIAVVESIIHAVNNGARIINLGLILENENTDIADAISYASDNGVIIFSPAGDNGFYSEDVEWPASRADVIAVGGTDLDDRRAKWGYRIESNQGPNTEISLPAENIEVRDIYGPNGNNPGSWVTSTTIVSCAMATGVAALMLSANPCLNADEIRDILIQSCEKVGGYSYNSAGWCPELGYGRLNAYTAVRLALGLNEKSITGNVIWDFDRTSGNIVIQPNSTLTLNNITLQMADEKNITVKVGGKLIVNGSVITNNRCNTVSHRWQGIKIEGNPSVWNANIDLQGYANIDNSSRIENARTAIDIVYSDKMGLISGGIVQAKNSVFLNNDLNFSFGEYGYRSGSSFNSCSFVLDQNYYGTVGVSQPMAYLWGNNGVHFNACTFENSSNVNNGIGILSYGSSYSINALCESTLAPCPEGSLIKSQFNNLAYGVRAYNTSNKIIINNAVFSSQRGVCITNCNFADILNTQFNIPEYYLGGIMPYGAHMDQSSGFHIEKNTFTGQNSNTTGNIGLYLFNTGSAQNYVYRNAFSNLSRAAVSDGNNRSSNGNTGLCFKCNDFSTNGTDIDVIPTPGVTPTLYTGISRYQGIPSLNNPSLNKDTLAAANVFTTSANYNIRNYSGNTTEYYYHENNPTGYKIFPNPVYQITRIKNLTTTYDRINICKSWLNTGGTIQQQLAQKSESKTNAEAAELVLQNTVDGGNTENLTFEVLASIPPDALELRDQLLLESPYLSDTVMKTAIDKENVLPNAMLRDILVQNPQAAKSDEIMNNLDERWEPMPDYMKEEIEAGKEIIGGLEQLEAVQAAWQQQEGLLFNQIVSTYLSDTISPNPLTELKSFLQNDNTSRACFVLAELCMQKGDHTGAVQAITLAQTNYTLTSDENQLATNYLSLAEVLAGFEIDNVSRYAVDSAHAIPLFTLYLSGNNNATAIARNILLASGLLSYQEPVNDVSDSLKSSIASGAIEKRENIGRINNNLLNVFPNPATSYTIIDYLLPKSDKATLNIISNSGNVIWQKELAKTRDQVVVALHGYAKGSYTVSIVSDKKIIATCSLIIVN